MSVLVGWSVVGRLVGWLVRWTALDWGVAMLLLLRLSFRNLEWDSSAPFLGWLNDTGFLALAVGTNVQKDGFKKMDSSLSSHGRRRDDASLDSSRGSMRTNQQLPNL
jgi:hypothetical protein